MIKGEIWWAELPNPRGSEPGKKRPVLVIQSDNFNRSAIKTIVCAVITSNINISKVPGNILLEKNESKLEKTSVVNFSQIITIDRNFFRENVSMLSKSILTKINESIKLIFDFE